MHAAIRSPIMTKAKLDQSSSTASKDQPSDSMITTGDPERTVAVSAKHVAMGKFRIVEGGIELFVL